MWMFDPLDTNQGVRLGVSCSVDRLVSVGTSQEAWLMYRSVTVDMIRDQMFGNLSLDRELGAQVGSSRTFKYTQRRSW
jgi:hypothetical protein